ncbi:hypothetical protein KKH82_02330 [Patescibacteria group bacterium]|nr:hypothetical protein [Patescibacteria group bacterium]
MKQKNMFMERYGKVSILGNNLSSKNVSGNAIVKSEDTDNGIIVYQVKN